MLIVVTKKKERKIKLKGNRMSEIVEYLLIVQNLATT
jgi:hypothetical protein